MLSIGKISAGPAAARYYTDQVARGRDDYYTGEGEAAGRWVGRGAPALGLRGEVETERFEDLLAGAGVRRAPRPDAVAGFDLTFRAPKSASVLWGVGTPAIVGQLQAGHEAAVGEALDYLERSACWARRGKDGCVQVQGRGFAAAAFLHRASRAGDPLLHTHVVVGNLTLGPDDRWTALDARHLYRHAKSAGYVYQAVLRAELTERLGVQWLPVENGVADIAGIPREVIEHFSTRRREILEYMAEHGAHSAKAAQVAALETRRAKSEPPVERLRDLWRARAVEHGLDWLAVERAIGRWRKVSPVSGVDAETLTAQASSFGRPEAMQAVAAAQRDGAHVAELYRALGEWVAKDEVVELKPGEKQTGVIERHYTTRGLLEAERELLDSVERRTRSRVAVARDESVERAIRGRGLSRDQETMVRDLCWRGDGVVAVRAPAGAGKTFALDAAREAWQADGATVFGCALSARAALELTDQAAIDATTVRKLREDLAHGHHLPRRSVLVVDESGMVGTRDLAALAKEAEWSQSKLVLVGDDRQLPEIDAGGAFRALAERAEAIELSEVRRQTQAWDRQALLELRLGHVERWARAYRDHGQITIGKSASDTRAALVNDWSRADGDALMIAARRDDVRDLNQRARELLHETGRLGPDELTVADRAFAVGDRVIGTRNARRDGILNGQRGTVREIDIERSTLHVDLDNGERVQLGVTYLGERPLDHAYATTAHRAQGATVDKTFVLGSEELYREWGYTALSRHREEARFYVARRDLGDANERDLPYRHDADVEEVGNLLRRSHAQELATPHLRDKTREELEREHDELHRELNDDRPRRRNLEMEDWKRDDVTKHLDDCDREIERLLKQRDELGLFKWGERSDIDDRLEKAHCRYDSLSAEHREIAETYERDNAHDQDWVARHKPEANRFLAVHDELHDRDRVDAKASRQLDALDEPQPLERGIERDVFDRLKDRPAPDLGRDIGPDLGR
jgi:conjugative relaxase-like TrwC/TraI family protein